MQKIEKVENKEIKIDNIDTVANVTNNEAPSSPIIAPKKRGATKGQLSEKTKDALAKGREKLNKKWEEDRNEKAQLIEKYAIKKANKKIKEKLGIKKQMGISEEDTEEEEPIKVIQPIKPKKKQTIILPEQSDSEEEIVYKKAPTVKKDVKPVIKEPEPIKESLRIVFF
jgi:hypothetical protein